MEYLSQLVRFGVGVLLVGDTCEEHVLSGKAGEALLEVDGLGDRDSYITPSRHVGRSRVSVKYRLEVGSEGGVFRRRCWGL